MVTKVTPCSHCAYPLPFGSCPLVSPILIGSLTPDQSQNLGLHSLQAISTPAEPPQSSRREVMLVKKAVCLNQKAYNSYQRPLGMNIFDLLIAINILV